MFADRSSTGGCVERTIMGDTISISLPTDENGLTGRECPQPDCEGYYKIKFGTGIKVPDYDKCFCPYCGYEGTQNQFFTKEQNRFIESIAMRYVEGVLEKEFGRWNRELRSVSRGSFIKLSLEYKSSHRSISYYAEKELETTLICENCTLEYAIYGKFARCPDCGEANSLQILSANLSFIEKLLDQALAQDDVQFKTYLLHNALEDVVSSFDSFGRNSIALATKITGKENVSISFQNIVKAKDNVKKRFGFDFSDALSETEWNSVIICFQKRHLISHNDGVIDDAYKSVTGDNSVIVGRKVSVSIEEVRIVLGYILKLAKNLKDGLVGMQKG